MTSVKTKVTSVDLKLLTVRENGEEMTTAYETDEQLNGFPLRSLQKSVPLLQLLAVKGNG